MPVTPPDAGKDGELGSGATDLVFFFCASCSFFLLFAFSCIFKNFCTCSYFGRIVELKKPKENKRRKDLYANKDK